MRACDGEDVWMMGTNVVLFRSETPGYDNLAILSEGLANSIERFRFGRVEKAAGIDDDRLSPGVFGRNRIALGT